MSKNDAELIFKTPVKTAANRCAEDRQGRPWNKVSVSGRMSGKACDAQHRAGGPGCSGRQIDFCIYGRKRRYRAFAYLNIETEKL